MARGAVGTFDVVGRDSFRACAGDFVRTRACIWLAGDAAHLTFPFGVRSMNEGIIEARQLATRCGHVLDGTAPVASLDSYGHERLAHWHALLASTEAPAPATTRGDSWLTANASGIIRGASRRDPRPRAPHWPDRLAVAGLKAGDSSGGSTRCPISQT